MKRSELRQIIKEELLKEDKVSTAFAEVLKYLRNKVYPKLDEDELYELNTFLKNWFNSNV